MIFSERNQYTIFYKTATGGYEPKREVRHETVKRCENYSFLSPKCEKNWKFVISFSKKKRNQYDAVLHLTKVKIHDNQSKALISRTNIPLQTIDSLEEYYIGTGP
jgi:hypothetical protein